MEKPLPIATPTTEPFWSGVREGQIRLQRCDDCGSWIWYPRSHCSSCLSRNLSWVDVSGRGTLHTFTLTRVPTAPFFADEMPQKLAVVELDEGVRLTSTLVGVEPDEIEIGMRLRPAFEKAPDGETVILRFEPDR